MLLILGSVIVLITVVIIDRLQVSRAERTTLGWMSERWLAEHRASHSL